MSELSVNPLYYDPASRSQRLFQDVKIETTLSFDQRSSPRVKHERPTQAELKKNELRLILAGVGEFGKATATAIEKNKRELTLSSIVTLWEEHPDKFNNVAWDSFKDGFKTAITGAKHLTEDIVLDIAHEVITTGGRVITEDILPVVKDIADDLPFMQLLPLVAIVVGGFILRDMME